MSRSFRKNPVCGAGSLKSEKESKKRWHSRFRSTQKRALAKFFEDGDYDFFLSVRAVSNPWSMRKDGKSRFSTQDIFLNYLRQMDPVEAKREAILYFRKLMRK